MTFVERAIVDYDQALRQHARYCEVLTICGAQVEVIPADESHPDCVFIEDTAIVLDELAVICRPGAASRRAEVAATTERLRTFRTELRTIESPATLEGGDLLRVGKTLLVGMSTRTNAAGIEALAALVKPFGYQVAAIPVRGALHLKTACSALPDGRFLLNREWIDPAPLCEFEQISIPSEEPWGANFVCLDQQIVTSAVNYRTIDLITGLGFSVHSVPLDEFAKAEGGATCLSLVFVAT